ncbi:aspartate aminotransferase family protein [Thermogymnomonas acidicola]|uniref:Glutamate-1-semialdehyde 2,1-aminomutase n=1 Tax=Thermogymnomonas acidicola TaxID=399579 RepID=A0AA37BPZ1_9ARCH|nr:glutamate-1-semialdehyde 2,1-aminomutase [Thermogymnomonas acidicola]GGM67597.1 aspartate aminotransferase family protein [Thermogymnomonas acidicola]
MENTAKSESLFRRADSLFPGGVNSPVRYFDPHPLFIAGASGQRVRDVDGNTYTDYVLGYGPMILGYGDPDVLARVQEGLREGWFPGAPNAEEVSLGEMIRESSPWVEKMRFVNSGTEATMHAIRLARAYTGRKVIVKMEGGFHGAHDYSLIRSGSGSLTFGTPSTPGVPEEVSATVAVASYNDIASVEAIFDRLGSEIAAVITEPVFGNVGLIPPEPGFLEYLRKVTSEHGSLLIFDEVITGYRVEFSAYQNVIGIRPDLTTMGKIIGGGAPIGLFGGRKEVMERVTPSGPVYQSGTFSANRISMLFGLATMEKLANSDYGTLNRLVKDMAVAIREEIEGSGKVATVNQVGPMFQIFFGKESVKNYRDAMSADRGTYMRFFRHMLVKGIYVPPSQFETCFVSFAHTIEDTEKFVQGFREFIRE